MTARQSSAIIAQLPSPSNNIPSLLSPTPTPVQPPTPAQNPLSFNEKHSSEFYAPSPAPALPPPSYATAIPATVANAVALYEYQSTDAGDLVLLPNDHIAITEFMNVDWAKGRNERTRAEGIFPRSYIRILDEKNSVSVPPRPTPSNYGNMPLDVSQSGTGPVSGKESKFNENGKKFGKKLGNASKLTSRLPGNSDSLTL